MRKLLLIAILMYHHNMVVGYCDIKDNPYTTIKTEVLKPHAMRTLPVLHRPHFPMERHHIFNQIVTPPPQLKITECGTRQFEYKDTVESVRSTTMEGATSTQHKEWPWMAHIEANKKCSGFLITFNHVVTTASCVFKSKAKDIKVTLGAIGRLDASDKQHEQVFQVESFKYHEYFHSSLPSHNIAILKLTKYVDCTHFFVYPICLPFNIPLSRSNFSTKFGFIAGFGTKTNKLEVVPTRVIRNDECYCKGLTVVETDICAGGAEYNNDYCWRDEGGALMASYFGKWYGLGVLSDYFSCIGGNQDASISSRIVSYLEWIKYYFV